uniref:Receptor-type tyrosine-protein phosphatase alpha n=1 Tax=Esox lucius TaxID=8010 RepID=A0A6Q2Y869_ESOLU
MPTSLLKGSMGVCPLLLLLPMALGVLGVPVFASAQGFPPAPTAKSLDPPPAPTPSVPTATPTTPQPPPTTAVPSVAVTTATTMTAATTADGLRLTTGPPPTPDPLPPRPPSLPPHPTDRVTAGVTANPRDPTSVSLDGGNGTVPSSPDTLSPDSSTDPPPETSAEPTVKETSADTSGATVPGNGGGNTDSQSDETPIIAVTVALSSLLVIVFIIIILYMLRFKRYKQAGSHSNSFRLTNGRSDDTELQSVPLLARSPSTNRKYPPLVVDKLEEEMNRRMADDNKLFREEFNALPVCPIQASCDAASKEENKEKNRPNRAALPAAMPTVLSGKYFGTWFGPKEETVNDFWRMIWEQNTATIVMVTNLKERKECKCAQYWPDQGCWTYGNVRVSVEDVMVLVDYTIRKFCIQQVGDVGGKKPQRLVTQFHFTSWPDFGVPFTPIGMLKFLKKVKTCNPQYAGPIVVHCSAGVGRTGTFIVIDAMLDMMNTERKVDVFGFVTRIRAQRCQMVQTDMQYVFIFQAMLEHYLYGDTELEVTSLEAHLAKLYAPTTAGCGGMEAEFKKLTSIKIQNDKMRTGNLPANMKKNRVLQIIPYEFNRVIIPVKRGEEDTDYVNASFVDGYRQKDSYIASQGPLQHTIEDFWRMIWEWRSCSVVMLTELEERGQEKCAQYWVRKTNTLSTWVQILCPTNPLSRSFENKARAVRQFHFHGWPEVGIPSDGKGMINIIAAVQKQQQQSGNHPITVHCSAGAGRTGTFCALSTVLERVKAEAILDVFQTVKSLRLQRPHMVQTLEQYEFCYKVVQEYIDAFSDYANFK